MLWRERNDAAFNGLHWHVEKLCCKVWLELIDYGRNAWTRTQEDVKKNQANLDKVAKIMKGFQDTWCSKSLFAKWDGLQPRWNLSSIRFSHINNTN
ncbi:hypothetical protein M758_9G090900, partial [Ceratodon purpureus]